MQKVYPLLPDNADLIKDLYNGFVARSHSDYAFELQPLPFDAFKANIIAGFLKVLVLEEDNIPKSMLIYIDALNEAIELNLIHCADNESIIERKKALMNAFVDIAKNNKEKSAVSYPMLGIQSDFVQDIAHFGFKMIGQIVYEFDFANPVDGAILASIKQEIPEGYKIVQWDDRYFDEAAQVVFEKFHDANDAKFDPRFQTIKGVKDIIISITSSLYGDFLPEETSVLLYGDEFVGVCFVNLTTPYTANIPLVAIKRPHHHKGFGTLTLSKSLNLLKVKRERESLNNLTINATTDTDNYPALRMYRKVGFKEKFNYPHSYLTL